MQDDSSVTLTIADPLSTRCDNTLTGQFVKGDKIALSAFRPSAYNSRHIATQQGDTDLTLIHFIQPEFIFDDPILRSLIAEANATFVALQSLNREGSSTDYKKVSRTYRSIIRACIEKLTVAAANVNDREAVAKTHDKEQHESENAKYDQYVSIFYSIECLWHLSEILFLNQTMSNVIVPQMLNWIRFHFPAPERMATNLLLLERDAGDSDEYWPALRGLILQGEVDAVRALLLLHPQAESIAFKMAGQILKAKPTYNAYSGSSIQKFRSQWQYWVTDTEGKLAANILSIEPNLEEIIQLVSGNTEVWNTKIVESAYWYEYFPGYLFYTNPACKHFELGSVARQWINRWDRLHKKTELKHLDRVILGLMESDMNLVIHSIQLMADNQWFVTHLVDLLYNSGQLQIICEHQIKECVNLRNSLLFEFGSSLMTRNSLWQLGMDYFDYCGNEGQAAMQLLLTKIPISTEKQALKIIEIAQKKGYTDAAQEICKVQSKKSFTDGRIGNSLEWAIRSNDSLCVTSIADFILNHYSKTGIILCKKVIANVGAKMFISPRLVFLVKYADFHRFYYKRDFLPAAELIVNLLNSKITPEYFWPSLLIDTLPFLEAKDPKILMKETCAILQHLDADFIPIIEKRKKHLIKYPEDPVNIVTDYRMENIEEIVNLIRLACSKNLSRAIIIESTILNLDDQE